MLAELRDWCQALSGDNPVLYAVQQSYNSARDRLRSDKEAAARARAEAQAVVTALEDKQGRIEYNVRPSTGPGKAPVQAQCETMRL